jgi:chromosome segregation ATPase
MDPQKIESGEQAALMALQELSDLRGEIAALRAEIDDLRAEADLDSCHIAGLSAQIKALIAESEACPNKAAHPLVERVEYVHSRTGEKVTKTRALPLYREAFDAEAQVCGIDNPGQFRS